MDKIDRILGELIEFKERTLDDLKDIKTEVKALQQFKWRVAGGAAILSVVLAAVIEVFKK